MENSIISYAHYLQSEERASGTVAKYLRDVRHFSEFLAGRNLTKDLVSAWKEELLSRAYAPVTVNSMLAALHDYLDFINMPECKVKYLKVQRRLFRDPGKELTRHDYEKLLQAAENSGKERLALIIETICATGIRVSELQYITVSAVKSGKAEISLKGKIRTILIPGKLSKKLIKYAKNQKVAVGEVFITKSGNAISRRQIWAEMKSLCRSAGVDAAKVFPHNLRHLFARAFYKVYKDIAKLADILGHSSIETTRIYLITTCSEYAKKIDRLGLIS